MLYVIDILDQPGFSFPDRFRRFLRLEKLELDWTLIDGVTDTAALGRIAEQNPSGIVISGSVRGVYENPAWMSAVEALIQEAYAQNIPLIGICFGHQLLAHALGGKVAKAPAWEFGVLPVFLRKEAQHPWLKDFPSGTLTIQTHQDQVTELPPGAKALGFSRQTAYQIFSIGSCLGIQFHPEYTREDLVLLAGQRAERLIGAGSFLHQEHVEAYADAMHETDASRSVLRHFLLSEALCKLPS